MTEEQIYLAINLGVLPAWVLLAIAPRAGITRRLVHSGIYPAVYGTLYISLLVAAVFFGKSAPGASMSDLAGVMALFSHPYGVLTGWTHYLVFDLFIGAWVGRDGLRRSVPHIVVMPSLLLCLMFGPVGLLLYLCARAVTGKGGWSLEE